MVTYLTDTLGFTSTENGIAILCMLIGSIPGALVAGKTVIQFNPVWSNRMATLLLGVNTVVAAFVLTGPGQQLQTYLLFSVFGLAIGWKWTTDRLLAATLIPAGQDAELMGVYIFAGQVLTWLPPLIFTAMNEAGISQSVGIGILSISFFLGLIGLFMMGDYDKAVEQTGRLASHAHNTHL
jgi:UMF1 family MFS transporter